MSPFQLIIEIKRKMYDLVYSNKDSKMLENQKYLFNLEEGIHYLNCAYKAPLLKSAEAAAIKDLIKQRNPVNLLPTDYFIEADQVRELFGSIVGCKSSEVAIIPSTSYGFASVLNNIECKQGQHALTLENEFPSDYFSIERWCNNHKADLKIIKSDPHSKTLGRDWNQEIIDSITEQTAVVIISSIHWMSGLKFDLIKIGARCKEVGAKFIVDGTQSVGALPINVKECNIDALVCATYKWLFGPYSVALAYIGEVFHNGAPLEETWMNRTNAQDFSQLTNYDPQYTPDAGRYNVGQFSNLTLMPMLIASLEQIKLWTIEGIQGYCKELIQPLLQYLKAIKVELEEEDYFSNHLFSLPLPSGINLENFKQELKNRKIVVSVRSGKLRVSVNVYNTPKDIQQLIRAIEQNRT